MKRFSKKIGKEAGRVGHQIGREASRLSSQISAEAGRTVVNVHEAASITALHPTREQADKTLAEIKTNCETIAANLTTAQAILASIKLEVKEVAEVKGVAEQTALARGAVEAAKLYKNKADELKKAAEEARGSISNLPKEYKPSEALREGALELAKIVSCAREIQDFSAEMSDVITRLRTYHETIKVIVAAQKAPPSEEADLASRLSELQSNSERAYSSRLDDPQQALPALAPAREASAAAASAAASASALSSSSSRSRSRSPSYKV